MVERANSSDRSPSGSAETDHPDGSTGADALSQLAGTGCSLTAPLAYSVRPAVPERSKCSTVTGTVWPAARDTAPPYSSPPVQSSQRSRTRELFTHTRTPSSSWDAPKR